MDDILKRSEVHYREIDEWRVLDELDGETGPLDYAMEEAVGEAVARREVPATLRIWQGPQALVVAKKDIRTPRALQAAQMMKQVDWPVYVRQSGGTAVPHGPGTINLSLFLPRPRDIRWNIDDIYRMLGLPLIRMLDRTFDLSAYFGEVPGSFCDGRYNVVVGGKKIVGTSQIWKGGPAGLVSHRPGYILAHATLLTQVDRERVVSALNAFYEMAEGGRPVYIDTVATLSSFVPGPSDEVERRARAGLLESVGELTSVHTTTQPTKQEREAAEAYIDRCRPEHYEQRIQS